MKKYHRSLFLLSAGLLLFNIVGCSSSEYTQPDNPNHFYEQVREDFLIDAEVYDFPNDTPPKVYEGVAKRYSEAEIDAFLIAMGDHLTEWGPLDTFMETYDGTTANGGYIYVEDDSSGLYPTYLSYTHPQSDWWGNYHIYAGQNHYDSSSQHVFADKFMEPVDFSFATAQEAETATRNVLTTIGFDNLILNRTLYIDHNILTQISSVLQEPEWQSLKDNTNPIKNTWTDADDGYIFEFFLSVDSIPMFYGIISQDTYTYCGTSIIVWYQAPGIVQMIVSYPFSPSAIVEEPAQIISAADAICDAKSKLSNILTHTNTVITKVSAEYIYVHDNGRFLLRPVWVIYATYDDVSLPGYSAREYVIIDAITGKEL